MTFECTEHQKRIPGLFLNDLTVEERKGLEKHLAECSHCRSEYECYVRTLNLMKSAENEPVPRHFFVYPKEAKLNPWQLFCRMQPGWRAVTAAAVAVFLLIGVAAVSRLHIQPGQNGWMVSFGDAGIDVVALKEDILKTVDARNREAGTVWMDEVRAEFARSISDLTQKQQVELATALERVDAGFNERIQLAEGRMRTDTREIAGDMYRAVSQQRAQDLDIINFRFDSMEATNTIKARQTNTILDTLLQEAELRLR
jgi:hypothetical protein